MVNHPILEIISVVLAWSQVVFNLSSSVLMSTKMLYPDHHPTIMNSVWKWSKYPALGNVLFGPALLVLIEGHLNWWEILIAVMNAALWWFYRDVGDDDFTKKLKKKLTEIAERAGAKLIVVPQGA